MTELSVIICTHDPRGDYFHRCLSALRAQTLSPHVWELVLVDNLSREALSGRLDLAWHHNARVVREETLGLTRARLRGVKEASGEILVFVDDDNVLDPDFLETARRVADEKPFLGAWSG